MLIIWDGYESTYRPIYAERNDEIGQYEPYRSSTGRESLMRHTTCILNREFSDLQRIVIFIQRPFITPAVRRFLTNQECKPPSI